MLTPQERAAIHDGPWFCALSPLLKHDILRCMAVRRYTHGQRIVARGDVATHWMACAGGAVRIGSNTPSGKRTALTYIGPGQWFGDTALFDGMPRTHDAHAHGETVLALVAARDFNNILLAHPSLYEAILRLHAKRIRRLFGQLEDLNTLTLRSRVAKQLLHLCRHFGEPGIAPHAGSRIGLHLAQKELAQLVGGARQRINMELKAMEREGVIQIEPSGLVVHDLAALRDIALASAMAEPTPQPAFLNLV